MKQRTTTLLLSVLVAIGLAIIALLIVLVSQDRLPETADLPTIEQPQETDADTDDPATSGVNDDIRPADGVTPDDVVPDAGLDFVSYTNNQYSFTTQVPDNLTFISNTEFDLVEVNDNEASIQSPSAFIYFAERPDADRGSFWGDVAADMFTGYTLQEVCTRAAAGNTATPVDDWVSNCTYLGGNKVGTPMATFTGAWSGISPEPIPLTVYVLPHPNIQDQYLAISSFSFYNNIESYEGTVLTLDNVDAVALRIAQFMEPFVPVE